MSRTLTLSDEVFARLQEEAQGRGLPSVEQLLAELGSRDESRERRIESVRRIQSMRESLRAKYGEMPDSTPSIRDDRLR